MSAQIDLDEYGWPVGSVDPDEIGTCPRCGRYNSWQKIGQAWRCGQCDPPPKRHRKTQPRPCEKSHQQRRLFG